MCTQKMRALSYIGAEKNNVSPKPRLTYGHTDRRTDISVYRVALLLKAKRSVEHVFYFKAKKNIYEF